MYTYKVHLHIYMQYTRSDFHNTSKYYDTIIYLMEYSIQKAVDELRLGYFRLG